jgi:hypothetical protein
VAREGIVAGFTKLVIDIPLAQRFLANRGSIRFAMHFFASASWHSMEVWS